MAAAAITVLIVDADDAFTNALAIWLETAEKFCVVGRAASGEQGFDLAARHHLRSRSWTSPCPASTASRRRLSAWPGWVSASSRWRGPPAPSAACHVAWSRFTGAVGLVLLATAAAYAARKFDLVDLLLVVGGALLLPAWLVWTGRLLREGSVEPAA